MHTQPKSIVPAVSTAVVAFLTLGGATNHAAVISNVVETGGDNELTDTITAKWTGQTFNVSVASEPFPGATIGSPYTVGVLGNESPAFVDRNHRYLNDPGTGGGPALPIPAYLGGLEYVMSGNDNRDNATYRLDITVTQPSIVYMFVDNRLGDTAAANPPTFDATHMQWMTDQGWAPTSNGLNRAGSTASPDELGIDEGADNTVNNWYSIYQKSVPAGTFSLLQGDNAGQNMYGVAVAAVPEPRTVALLLTGVFGLVWSQRRTRR